MKKQIGCRAFLKVLLGFLMLASSAFCSLAADSSRDLSSMADYARWIQPWSEHTNVSSQLGVGLKAIVTIVSGEQPMAIVTNLSPVERLKLAYQLKTAGTEITTNGIGWSYFASNSGAKETPVHQLSVDELKQLDGLLARLPDDDLSLPPPGRRVVVQVWEQDHWRIRVYNRAAVPAEILAILALIKNPFEKEL